MAKFRKLARESLTKAVNEQFQRRQQIVTCGNGKPHPHTQYCEDATQPPTAHQQPVRQTEAGECSPRPWSVNDSKAYDEGHAFVIWGTQGAGFGAIARTGSSGLRYSERENAQHEANAREIVKCVNAYPQLIAVLRVVTDALVNTVHQANPYANFPESGMMVSPTLSVADVRQLLTECEEG